MLSYTFPKSVSQTWKKDRSFKKWAYNQAVIIVCCKTWNICAVSPFHFLLVSFTVLCEGWFGDYNVKVAIYWTEVITALKLLVRKVWNYWRQKHSSFLRCVFHTQIISQFNYGNTWVLFQNWAGKTTIYEDFFHQNHLIISKNWCS